MNRKLASLAVVGLLSFSAAAENGNEPPQYGGALNVGTVYWPNSALSWDNADWAWKSNHDTGAIYEQLFAADLSKSEKNGGPYPFRAEAWLPEDALRGELAESWEWEGPLTLVVKLRRGIMFTDKPGMMKARELVADDVLFTFERQDASPKKIAGYFDHIESVTQRDDHTVVFELKEFNSEWAYRFGYGYYSGIVPRELAQVDPKDWRNVNGTGPFQLTRYIQGNIQTYSRNPSYWDRETLGGKQYEIPFVDALSYRVIKDEATILTALRTGKLDILESIRWLVVDHLKETTPELKWSRWLSNAGTFVAMRMDMEPFDDIRVRRALNLAVNQQEIVDLYYGGHAELFGYPMHTEFVPYYQPLEEMPASVQELFSHDPDRAKQMLAEAGFPDGFTFKAQVCTCNPDHMDLIPLIVSYLDKVGVTMEVEPMEYASFLSMMTTKNHGPGYFMSNGHTNPTTSLRKSLFTDQQWNPALHKSPEIDEKIFQMLRTRDEPERDRIVKELVVYMVDLAPYIWLPTRYLYSAWWPWVKNYNGELRAGAVRPGPIYARLWIDQEMKLEMGFD
ncbi:MAG: ABC transporter substrate-binding protein [Acidobacteriota bacterium]|nr:ABC transporter substrate-binding protein [Acidobacteriota bacterium]